MPGDRGGQRRAVRRGGPAGGERPEQRFGEGEQAGHGSEGVARQADEVPARGQAGQQHGVPGAYRHPVHQHLRVEPAQGGMHMVDGARRGTARRDHHVSGGLREGGVQGVGLVGEMAGRRRLDAQRMQPGGEHRAEGIADPAVPRQPLVQQLVAQDEDFGTRTAVGGQLVVAGRRGQAEDGGGHQGTRGQQLVAAAALLAARADVLAGRRGPRCVQPSSAVAQLTDLTVLAAQYGGGARGDARPGGDRDRMAVEERLGGGVTGEDAGRGARLRCVGGPVQAPGAGAGDRPAVHRRGVERRQIGERGEGCGERTAECLAERRGLGRGRPGGGALGETAGGVPGDGGRGGARAGAGGRRGTHGARGAAPGGGGVVRREGVVRRVRGVAAAGRGGGGCHRPSGGVRRGDSRDPGPRPGPYAQRCRAVGQRERIVEGVTAALGRRFVPRSAHHAAGLPAPLRVGHSAGFASAPVAPAASDASSVSAAQRWASAAARSASSCTSRSWRPAA